MNVKPEQTGCAVTEGTLPGTCAPMVFPFIAMQTENSERYDSSEALKSGTLFPGLNLPFHVEIQSRFPTVPAALAELMALDFAIDELGLYLVTHSQDQEALQLYWSYINLAKEGREKYQKLYGPLLQTDLTPDEGFAWLKDPWPWDEGGNS